MHENKIRYLKTTPPPVWPIKVTGHDPSSTDHIFNLMSIPPDNTTAPDGKNLQCVTSLI